MPCINVVDMYHGDNHDELPNFGALKDAGVKAIIHKASQGDDYLDPKYQARKAAALAAGLQWGAYHYMTDAPIQGQIAIFRRAENTSVLRALDYERSKGTPNATQLLTMARSLEASPEMAGRTIVLYGGDLVRETIAPQIGMMNLEYLGSRRLWLAEYGPHERVPSPWKSVWLWQFTETGRVPIIGNVDGNWYAGTDDQLAADFAA